MIRLAKWKDREAFRQTREIPEGYKDLEDFTEMLCDHVDMLVSQQIRDYNEGYKWRVKKGVEPNA